MTDFSTELTLISFTITRKSLNSPTPSPIYTNLHRLLVDIILICLSICNEKNMSASPPCILDSLSESGSYTLDVMNKKNMHRSPQMWKPSQRRLKKLLPWFNAIPASPKPKSVRSHIYPAFINTLKLKYPSISHASSSRGPKKKKIWSPTIMQQFDTWLSPRHSRTILLV